MLFFYLYEKVVSLLSLKLHRLPHKMPNLNIMGFIHKP